MSEGGEIQLREFEMKEDWNFALQHHLEMIKDESLEWTGGDVAEKLYRAHLENSSRDSNAIIFIAERGGTQIGLIEAHYKRYERKGHISDLYVAPHMRNQGIGEKLVMAAEDWVRQKGAESVDLNVTATNTPAVRLYQKLDYKIERLTMRKRLKATGQGG